MVSSIYVSNIQLPADGRDVQVQGAAQRPPTGCVHHQDVLPHHATNHRFCPPSLMTLTHARRASAVVLMWIGSSENGTGTRQSRCQGDLEQCGCIYGQPRETSSTKSTTKALASVDQSVGYCSYISSAVANH